MRMLESYYCSIQEHFSLRWITAKHKTITSGEQQASEVKEKKFFFNVRITRSIESTFAMFKRYIF